MSNARNARRHRFAEAQDERPTGPDSFMLTVINRVGCLEHNAGVGWDPCFEAEGLTEESNTIYGICNNRAKAAGMNGTINPNSMTRRPFERGE